MKNIAEIALIAKKIFRKVKNRCHFLKLPLLRTDYKSLPKQIEAIRVDAFEPVHHHLHFLLDKTLLSFPLCIGILELVANNLCF